ncbi:MAG: acetolactate synthase small subunit [Saprospiraceae bacterium]|nr:acetolactate synthase small subunit [Saprospiraceae bacterium]
MKEKFTICIFTENQVGLLHRLTTIFTRRHINIESLTTSEAELDGVHRFTISVECEEEQVEKLSKQLSKQVGTLEADYYREEETVWQEIALFKVSTNAFFNGTQLEEIIRSHRTRILEIEPNYVVLEQTGYKEDTQTLFEKLKPFGILEFVRSGRVSISKTNVPFKKEKETILKKEKH